MTGTAKLDLTLYADTPDGETTTLIVEYSADLFDKSWAQRFLGCMVHLLTHAAEAPGTSVADLPLLSIVDTRALIAGRNPQTVAGQAIRDVRAAITSASRVIDGDQTVSMAEVCDRAARIARTLADAGVGPETLVGLCLERGVGMLSALLGV